MYDIVIVGAGIAGLNTARLLNNKNKKICILEKSNRVGGMMQSLSTPSSILLPRLHILLLYLHDINLLGVPF